MQSRKIFEILTTLDKHKLKRFDDFVHSPYFNKHKQVQTLWNYLKESVREEAPLKINSEWLYRQITSVEGYDAKRLNHLYSYLLDLLTQFLAIEGIVAESPFPNIGVGLQAIKQLRKTSLSTKHLQALLRKQQQQLAQFPYQNAQHYYQNYELHEELDALFLAAPSRAQDLNLQSKSDFLDYFYLYSKLKIACDMASRNIVINADYQCHLLPEVLQFLLRYPTYGTQPGVAVYAQILQMLQSGSPDDYQALKVLLSSNIRYFEPEEALLMYDYAQNFCIRRINSGETSYYLEFLDLYKIQLEKGILFRNGYLEEWDYKNIVTAGVRTGDYKWTEQFIESNKKYLKPEVLENAYIYNLANLYYETQRYKEALRLLHQVEFTDPSYHLGAKYIQLKSYYESDELTAFDALVHAFREYVRRNKQLSEYRRRANLNFLRIAQKLGQLKESATYSSKIRLKKDLEKITTLLTTLSPMANSDWLEIALEKLAVPENY